MKRREKGREEITRRSVHESTVTVELFVRASDEHVRLQERVNHNV